MRLKSTILGLLFFTQLFSQTPSSNSQKIGKYIETYFQLDRENIHVQFNKDTYVNNEDIAFKGYVLSTKEGKPNTHTTNVQLVIYDDQEQIIQKQLLFTEKGVFSGGIHLNDKFKSGNYHFHFYTNWMNNFNEDYSFTEKIEIIDKNEVYNIKPTEPNWKTATATFFPEGNIIIDGINNTVGVKLTDCNQKPIEAKDILIVDSKSNEITRFDTNKMGNGSFYFIPSLNETYTLKIKTDKLNVNQPLPKIDETGLTLSYNNNLPKSILAVAVKTNDKGLQLYKGKKFILLLHQNINSVQKEFTLKEDENETVLLFDKKFLSNGVNSIRLIDENLNEVTERLVYHYGSAKPETTLVAKAIANDSIALYGKTNATNSNISISVLPKDNINSHQKKCIQGSFYLNPFLATPENNNFVYYDNENKTQKQDMELLMLNQKSSKYTWTNIKENPPTIKYNFNKGVTINGTVNKSPEVNSKFKISLISLKDNVFEDTTIDKNSNFKFENFYAQDSTVFILQMKNDKNIIKQTEILARVSANESKFMFPLRLEKNLCPIEKKPENNFVFTKPALGNSIINLEGVTIQNDFKNNLKYQNEMGLTADGYKIVDEYGSILDYLTRKGFRTGLDPETNTVFIRNPRDLFAEGSPAVYLDNAFLFDLNMLYGIDMSQVDEMYIDKTGFSDAMTGIGGTGGTGTIKIFLKEGANNAYFKVKHSSLVVTNGFSKNIDFKNATFETQKEYFYFGTLNWTPSISLKEKSEYELKFPKVGQKEIKVLVEGFTNDGQLISEYQTIPVE
ncbi:hypothetical protein [Flavobacterium sp. UMI-01]|uniref:hypothetical protein n=1 Tax=Flavobacterium sp. UMI-01 TaxID=1441053 RepID=UPI001C7CF432|nr:hypothetical protein [Flavobacterium sp. UMI-01]GIZ08918.1 hypothetical protein FUMI01_16450 [Flavobacterium sp. UMI-01]